MNKSQILAILLVMFISCIFTANAEVVTVYTDKTQWEDALSGQFLTEDFNDPQLNDGLSFVSSESGHINPAEGYYQDVLASQSQNEPMTIWSFGHEIYAYGGNWTLGGPGGSGNSLLVSIDDSSFYVGAISNNYGGGFWGFISDTPFLSVKLIGGGGSHQQNYRLDNMAYSYVGDFDSSGSVDYADLEILANQWLDVPAVPSADIYPLPTGDNIVNFLDLALLAQYWLKGVVE